MGDLHSLRGAADIDLEEETKTDLLEHILLQLKIMNKQLAIMTNEDITINDIEEDE